MSSGLFELTKGVWTKITTSEKSGKVLHITGAPSIVYIESPIEPVGYDENTPTAKTSIVRESFLFGVMLDDDFLWAYAINGDAIISVTPSATLATSSIADNGGVPDDVDRPIRIEGHNPNVGGGNVWNDIWEGGALIIPEPSTLGEQLQVVSSSSSDSAGDIGTTSVRIEYLNTDEQLVFEDIELTGTTPALTVATNITDIVDFYSISVGSNGVAVGNIDITEVGNIAVIYNRIAAGGNKSMSTLRHLLPSSTAYLTSIIISGDTKGTDVMLRSDSNDSGDVFPGVWLFQVPITMSDSPVSISLNPAIVIPPNARVKVSARAGASGNTISVFINGWVKI